MDEKPRSHPDDNIATAKIVLGVLCGFQFAVIAIVLLIAPSREAGAYSALVGWGWAALAIALIAGPLLWRWRLTKVRRKRDQLLRSEWLLDD